MATAAHCDQQIVVAANFTAPITSAALAQRAISAGMTIERAIPDAARRFITVAGAREHGAALARAEVGDVGGFENDGAAGARDRRQVG